MESLEQKDMEMKSYLDFIIELALLLNDGNKEAVWKLSAPHCGKFGNKVNLHKLNAKRLLQLGVDTTKFCEDLMLEAKKLESQLNLETTI